MTSGKQFETGRNKKNNIERCFLFQEPYFAWISVQALLLIEINTFVNQSSLSIILMELLELFSV